MFAVPKDSGSYNIVLMPIYAQIYAIQLFINCSTVTTRLFKVAVFCVIVSISLNIGCILV